MGDRRASIPTEVTPVASTCANFAWSALCKTISGASLALTLALCGCESSDNVVIDLQDKAFPTGLDHWPARKLVLFGTFAGSIYSIQEDGTRVAKLMDVRTSDCSRVTRIRVDEVRNRLWIMSAAGICVYNLQSLQMIRHLPIGDISRHRLANGLTDIALDSHGNAYAIDTGIAPIIYRIESATFAVEVWNKIVPRRSAGIFSSRHFPLNAVAVTPQGKNLLYVNAYDGTLNVIDIASRQQTAVVIPNKLYAVNALVAAPGAGSAGGIDLYAVSASNNSVTVVGMDGDLKTARMRVLATKLLDQPLTGTWVRGSVFITNSQILRHPEVFSEDREVPRPFSIVRLNSAYFGEQAANPVLDPVLGQ